MPSQASENPNQAPLPTPPKDLLKTLQSLDIEYKYHEHAPTFTVEESDKLKTHIAGVHCRNLYLRDKKKKNFLIVAANETEVDMKRLQEKLGCGRLSFGSADRLWEFLGIRPGSVCPFTVINDPEHHVQVVLDAHMMRADIVNYHPMDNAMTIGITPEDLLKFFAYTGHEPITLDL